jgi:hypothetical protein
MTTFITEPVEVEAQDTTPGCGCCIPPPDTVDTRVAELQARRDRLERRLRGLTS